MELLVFLVDQSEPDRYFHDEWYETDPETGELLIHPPIHLNTDAVITTYNRDKWIKARRVLDPGEMWPRVGEEAEPTPEEAATSEEVNVRHAVSGNPYAESIANALG